MNCTACKNKGCRHFEPCNDFSEKYIEEYHKEDIEKITNSASKLVDNKRAGSLSRLEEIVEYLKEMNIEKIGIAYCYGLESFAEKFTQYMKKNNIKVNAVSCTVDSVSETQLDNKKTKEVVSCNPIGQAKRLNESDVKLVVSIGLCLGHDIIFNKYLEKDHTVFAVKDRVFKHNPLKALK